jgi:predicted phage tail protein
MKVVKVYGALRKKLGQCRFEFDVDTPAQAIKALCINFPGLEQWLINEEAAGAGFRIGLGKDKITKQNPEGLVLPWSEREVFSITPVVIGAGQGVGQIFAGIGLIALSILVPGLGAGVAAATIFGTPFTALSLGIGLTGASLLLTGVSTLISPQQSMGGFTSGREAARLESFSFSGIVNTSKQGLPVPVAYGRLFVGSAVISSGLDVNQTA